MIREAGSSLKKSQKDGPKKMNRKRESPNKGGRWIVCCEEEGEREGVRALQGIRSGDLRLGREKGICFDREGSREH